MDTNAHPNAIVQTVTTGEITLRDARRQFHVGRIVRRFGQWAVTAHGIECLATAYAITKDRIWENDWVHHMRPKTWVNLDEFTQAFEFAQKYFAAQNIVRPAVPAAEHDRNT